MQGLKELGAGVKLNVTLGCKDRRRYNGKMEHCFFNYEIGSK